MNFKKTNISIITIIIILHLVGIIGIYLNQTRSFFLTLTPINLLITSFCFIYLLKPNSKIKFVALVTFVFGFLIEVLGVKTGQLFGVYEYGNTLGYQILDVPLTMGINWLILGFSTFGISNYIFNNPILKILFASLLMVGLDYFIEPVAIQLDFWSWEHGVIPFQNYVMWFIASVILHSIYLFTKIKVKASVALTFYSIQSLFFIILNLLLPWNS